MASLYIKDSEIAARVHSIAQRLGTTKTEAVHRALSALEERLSADEAPKPGFAERMRAYRAAHPLPPPTGLKADKAFFDRLWGEAED